MSVKDGAQFLSHLRAIRVFVYEKSASSAVIVETASQFSLDNLLVHLRKFSLLLKKKSLDEIVILNQILEKGPFIDCLDFGRTINLYCSSTSFSSPRKEGMPLSYWISRKTATRYLEMFDRPFYQIPHFQLSLWSRGGFCLDPPFFFKEDSKEEQN